MIARQRCHQFGSEAAARARDVSTIKVVFSRYFKHAMVGVKKRMLWANAFVVTFICAIRAATTGLDDWSDDAMDAQPYWTIPSTHTTVHLGTAFDPTPAPGSDADVSFVMNGVRHSAPVRPTALGNPGFGCR